MLLDKLKNLSFSPRLHTFRVKSGVIVLSAFFILVFGGCGSTPKSYLPPELYEVNRKRIEDSINDGNITLAIQDFLLWDGGKTTRRGGEHIDLLTRISESLVVALREDLKNKNYSGAINLTISAEQLGWMDLFEEEILPGGKPLTIPGLRRDWILHLIQEDLAVKALGYVRQLTDLSSFSEGDLRLVLETALVEKKFTTARRISSEMKNRNIEYDEKEHLSIETRYTRGDLIRGTVTIWVNRGMRIQEGVGMPDRVIGSGFYIDKRGYLITNYHVISSQVDPKYEGYSRLYIRPSDDPDVRVPARVIGWDEVFDIALLKVEMETDTVLSFSPEQSHEPGERIFAIGSPAGLENTLTSGIISAGDRRFLQMGNVMQVDVPINQGNSGGPLLDEEGDLIGVVFAGIEQFEGINFAIPVKWLIHIFPELYNGGKIEHPFLGVSLERVDNNMEVTYVFPGSPAHRIGMEVGSVLNGIGGKKPTTMVEAHDALLEYDKGTLLEIRWQDLAGVEKSGFAALQSRPNIPLERAVQFDRRENLFSPAFGMQVEKVQDNLLGTRYIVKKVFQGSIADETGMSVNDPFSIQQWKYMEKEKILLAQIRIKKRKAGFLETGVQLGAYVETPNFL